MMTLAQIIEEARGILQETNPDNSHVTDAQLTAFVQDCTLQICSLTATYPKTKVTDIVTAANVILADSMLRLDYAAYQGPDGKYHKLTTVDFVNFDSEHPDWINTDPGIPTHMVRMDNRAWMMWPTPAGVYLGVATMLIGSVLPTAISLPTDIPPVSQALHGCYSHYLAWKAFLLINDPDRAKGEFSTFDTLRKLNLKTATSTTGSRQQLRMQM